MRLPGRRAAAVAAVVAAAASAVVVEVPIPDGLRGRISEKVESYLGATLAYRDGGVSLLRGARLEDVLLTGAEGETVSIREARLAVDPIEFLRFLAGGDVVLGAVEARDAVLPIRRRRDGRIVVPLEPRDRSGRFVIRIVEGRVRYRDDPLGFDREVAGVGGEVRLGEAPEARLEGGLPADVGGRWAVEVVPIEGRRARLSLALLDAEGADAGRAGGEVEMTGAAAFVGDLSLEIDAGMAARLLRRRLPARGRIGWTGRLDVAADRFSLAGDVRAERIEAAGLEVRRFAGRLAFDGERLRLSNAEGDALGGALAVAAATVPLSDPDAWRAQGRLAGADAGAAFAVLGRGGARLTGTLAADLDLRGAPRAPYGVVGSVRLRVAEGAIDAPALERLVRLSGDPALKPLAFRTLAADVRIGPAGLEAAPLGMTGTQIGARGAARVGADRSLDGEVTFLVDDALAERMIGAVARTLPNEGGRRLVPTSLGGTLDDPKVLVRAERIVAGAVIGAPQHVIEKVGRTIADIFH